MTSISLNKIRSMVISASKAIEKEYEYINELNVFPVPDGDTGSNMHITISEAVNSIIDKEYADLQLFGKAFSRALLMNARGNSGVIFSQIMKGFVSVFESQETEVSLAKLVQAFVKAKEVSYKSVISPVEGTILTVIRVTSEKLVEKQDTFTSVEDLFAHAVKEAKIILDKTPDFLQDLKEAGVVDSGGYGLWIFLNGMYQDLIGQVEENTNVSAVQHVKQKQASYDKSFVDNNDGFGYCCEFIVKLGSKVVLVQEDKKALDVEFLKKELLAIGDSLAVVQDEDILKVHVHTTEPYRFLKIGQQYGEFEKIKIENMTFQFLERNPGTTLESLDKQKNTQTRLCDETKLVVTVPSEALQKIFKENLAVDQALNCEHTGNPSIEEFLNAIRATKSKNVVLIVDDSNMCLAAKEAIALIEKDINVHFINAKDVLTSYIVCLSYVPLMDYQKNIKNMDAVLKRLSVGKVSRSVKDVNYSHLQVRKNNYIAILDKKIIFASDDVVDTAKELANHFHKTSWLKKNNKVKNAYLIYGDETTPNDLLKIQKIINEKFGVETILINGKQKVYSYYLAIER